MIIVIEAAHANKKKRTGVEEYCFQFIENLKKIIPTEDKVILYSNKPLIDEFSPLPENWQVKILSWPLSKLWSQFRLSWEFLFFKPDIFFAPGQLIPFITPKNTVCTIHDSAFIPWPKVYSFFGGIYLRAMNWWIVKKAGLILTSTRFNVKELKKYYGGKVEKKVKIVPLAYNHNIFNAESIVEAELESTFKKYSINPPYLISIGRLESKKNTSRIIQSFDVIKKDEKYKDLKLVLIGPPGYGYEEVEKVLNNSPNKKDILLPGFVKGDPLKYLLSQAEAFVFPSLYEGFGLPVLEAMACGCPVVVSKDSACDEVGENVVIAVEPTDSTDISQGILKILEREDLRKKLVDLGLEKVKNYSWDKTIRQSWTESLAFFK